MKLYLYYRITKNGQEITNLKPNELTKLGLLTKQYGDINIDRIYK